MFGYDAFGNVRSSQGVATADAMGGDFRFQGQWFDQGTGLYNFRAQDYDARTGTFLSRDPVDPTEQDPEALNPYQFAYGNSYVYSDPSGMLTLGELNASQAIDSILEKAQAYVYSQVRQYAVDQAKGIAGGVIRSLFSSILPFDVFAAGQAFGYVTGGTFANVVQNALCKVIGDNHTQFFDNLHFEAEVAPNGNPLSDGFSCGPLPSDSYFFKNGTKAFDGLLSPRPDLIVKQGGPASTDRQPPSYLVLEIKRSVQAALSGISKQKRQWSAFVNYAQPASAINLKTKTRGHQYVPIGVYATLFDENKPGQLAKLEGKALAAGVELGVVSLLPGGPGRG